MPATPRQCCGLLFALSATATQAQTPRPAEPATLRAQAAVRAALPFGQEADAADFADARRGFIATLPGGEIKAVDGRVVYTLRNHAFMDASTTAPDTVNPSLWRQARLNQMRGLFKVTERVYQVRSLDISNMTIVEGDSGLIVIDPLRWQPGRCA